jgi:hypothetical protein
MQVEFSLLCIKSMVDETQAGHVMVMRGISNTDIAKNLGVIEGEMGKIQ